MRELDRFLSILIDEVAGVAGIEPDALAVLITRRNTANKHRMLHDALGRSTPHHRRLRALGRSRDCLFYCNGLVRRADRRHGSRMTAGWSAACGATSWPLGSRIALDDAGLGEICRFYDRLADELLATAQLGRPPGADGCNVAPMRPYRIG